MVIIGRYDMKINQIKGYENVRDCYTIDEQGNVSNGKIIIKYVLDKDGYPYYTLRTINGGRKHVKIHRVLAEWLIPNPDNFPMVRHLNDNKLDWRIENLAWGNDSHNMYDAIRNGNHKSVNSKPTKCIETEKVYKSATEASKDIGIDRSCIVECCNGKQKTAGGYHWEYIKED